MTYSTLGRADSSPHQYFQPLWLTRVTSIRTNPSHTNSFSHLHHTVQIHLLFKAEWTSGSEFLSVFFSLSRLDIRNYMWLSFETQTAVFIALSLFLSHRCPCFILVVFDVYIWSWYLLNLASALTRPKLRSGVEDQSFSPNICLWNLIVNNFYEWRWPVLLLCVSSDNIS